MLKNKACGTNLSFMLPVLSNIITIVDQSGYPEPIITFVYPLNKTNNPLL